MNPLPARLPRLVAVDLDGTLLDPGGEVSDRAVDALARIAARGTHVVVCTGRPPRLTVEWLERTRIETAICYNGASRLEDGGARVTHELELDAARARTVIARLRNAAPGALLGIETSHGWYLDDALWALRRPQLEARGRRPDGVGPVESFVRGGVIKILARHERLDAVALADRLGTSADTGGDVYATWSGRELLEILHPDVNKRGAVARLAAALDVPRARVAAFGDQRNDRELLAWAGVGVAMANGADEARAAADVVAPGNDADGVAATLETWLAAFEGDDA